MNPMHMARFAVDALRGRASDPSWNAAGQQLPPQAVLDQPIPMPPQQMPEPMLLPAQGSGGGGDPQSRAESLRALIEQRMREQEAAARMAQ